MWGRLGVAEVLGKNPKVEAIHHGFGFCQWLIGSFIRGGGGNAPVFEDLLYLSYCVYGV